jgi:hypothetical protein
VISGCMQLNIFTNTINIAALSPGLSHFLWHVLQ